MVAPRRTVQHSTTAHWSVTWISTTSLLCAPKKRPITVFSTWSLSPFWTTRSRPSNICRNEFNVSDVQNLLQRVAVRASAIYSAQFPSAMPCRIVIHLQDGQTLMKEKYDYEGLHTRPMSWPAITEKFERLSGDSTDATLRKELAPRASTGYKKAMILYKLCGSWLKHFGSISIVI